MRAPRAAAALGLAAAAITACGSTRVQPSPTPSPLPPSVLQQRYLAAATAYDTAEGPVLRLEQESCGTAGGGGDLSTCESALSDDRQHTISFDNAVRMLRLPASLANDVGRLLADDSQAEMLLEQASTAPSFTALASLLPQLNALEAQAAADATRVRTDLGLPTPAASPSAQA